MTEQQIKRAKRLAEILGLTTRDVVDHFGNIIAMYDADGRLFLPEQDKALLWDLKNKSKVCVDYFVDEEECTGVCYVENKDYQRLITIDFDSVADLPAALIDCVIEINGGYDE